jgi:hypothetical protein
MAILGKCLRHVFLAGAIAVLLPGAWAQNHIPELQTQFNRENDPARKVKILTKLGDAQFALMRKETGEGNYEQALRTLEEYRDEVRTAETALKATGADAERKPGGFKQLEIYLRKGLREIDQTILAIPDDQRPPFDVVRRDLLRIDRELIDMLFPRQPGKEPEKEKPKG